MILGLNIYTEESLIIRHVACVKVRPCWWHLTTGLTTLCAALITANMELVTALQTNYRAPTTDTGHSDNISSNTP